MSVIRRVLDAVFIPPDATDLLEFDDSPVTTTPPFPTPAPPPDPTDPLRYIGPIPASLPEDSAYAIDVARSLPRDFHPDTGGIHPDSAIVRRLNSVVYHEFPPPSETKGDVKLPDLGPDVHIQPISTEENIASGEWSGVPRSSEEIAWEKTLLWRLNNVLGCEDNVLGVKGQMDYPKIKTMRECVGYLRGGISSDDEEEVIHYGVEDNTVVLIDGEGDEEAVESDERISIGFDEEEVVTGGFEDLDDTWLKKEVKMVDVVEVYDPVGCRDVMRRAEWRNRRDEDYGQEDGDEFERDEEDGDGDCSGWVYHGHDDYLSRGNNADDIDAEEADYIAEKLQMATQRGLSGNTTGLKAARQVVVEGEDTSTVGSSACDNESEEGSIDMVGLERRIEALEEVVNLESAATDLFATTKRVPSTRSTQTPTTQDFTSHGNMIFNPVTPFQMITADKSAREVEFREAFPDRARKHDEKTQRARRRQQEVKDAMEFDDAEEQFINNRISHSVNEVMRNVREKKQWHIVPIYKLRQSGITSWYLLLAYHDIKNELLRVRVWSPFQAGEGQLRKVLPNCAARLAQFMLRELCPPNTKLWCRTTYGPLEPTFHPNSAVEVFVQMAKVLSNLEMYCSRRAGLGIMFRRLADEENPERLQKSELEWELYRHQMFNAVKIWSKGFYALRDHRPMHLPIEMLESIQTICGHHGNEIFKALSIFMDCGARGVLIGHCPDPADDGSSNNSTNPQDSSCSASSLLEGKNKTCKCRIKIIPVTEGSMVLLDGNNVERSPEVEYYLNIQRQRALNASLNLSDRERQFTESVLNNPSSTLAIYADHENAQGEKNVYVKACNSFQTSWEINGQFITQSEFLGPIPHISFLTCGSQTRWLWLGKIEDSIYGKTTLPVLADSIPSARDRVVTWDEVHSSNREHVLHHHHRPPANPTTSTTPSSSSSQPASKLWASIPSTEDVVPCTNHRCFAKHPTAHDKTLHLVSNCADSKCEHRTWDKQCNKKCWGNKVPHNPSRKWVPPGVIVHKPVLLNTMDAPMKDGEPMRELAKVHGPSDYFIPPMWFMPISWQPSDGFVGADVLGTTHPNTTGDPKTGHVFDNTALVELEVKRLDLWNSIPDSHKERIWNRGKGWLENNPNRIKRVLSSDQMGLRKAKRRKLDDGSGLRGWFNPMSYFGRSEEKMQMDAGGFGGTKIDTTDTRKMRGGDTEVDSDNEEEWTLEDEYWSPEPVPLKPLGAYRKLKPANPIERLKSDDEILRNGTDEMSLQRPTKNWRPNGSQEGSISRKRRISETIERFAKRPKVTMESQGQQGVLDLADAMSDIAIGEGDTESPTMKKIPRGHVKGDNVNEEDYGNISLPKSDTPQKRKYHEYIVSDNSQPKGGNKPSDNHTPAMEEPEFKTQKTETQRPHEGGRLVKSAPEASQPRQKKRVSFQLPKSAPNPRLNKDTTESIVEHKIVPTIDESEDSNMDVSDDSTSDASGSVSSGTSSSQEAEPSEESDTSEESPSLYEKCLGWL